MWNIGLQLSVLSFQLSVGGKPKTDDCELKTNKIINH